MKMTKAISIDSELVQAVLALTNMAHKFSECVDEALTLWVRTEVAKRKAEHPDWTDYRQAEFYLDDYLKRKERVAKDMEASRDRKNAPKRRVGRPSENDIETGVTIKTIRDTDQYQE